MLIRVEWVGFLDVSDETDKDAFDLLRSIADTKAKPADYDFDIQFKAAYLERDNSNNANQD